MNVRGEDAPNQIGRPFVTPPAVPTNRVQVLRSAFEETVRDTALLASEGSKYVAGIKTRILKIGDQSLPLETSRPSPEIEKRRDAAAS